MNNHQKDPEKPKGQVSTAGQGSQPKDNNNRTKRYENKGTKGPKQDEWSGHITELKDYVITDSNTNKASQFKAMHDRLITWATREYSANVGISIQTLKKKSMVDFMPDPLDKSLYTQTVTNGDGATVEIVDEGAKESLMAMQTEITKRKTSQYLQYNEDMRAMFMIIMGQVDENFKTKIESDSRFTSLRDTCNTIELLILLRNLCYRDARTKVHRMTNLIRAERKLLTSRQKNDDASAYVREVVERFKVLKSLGGSVISNESIDAVMQLDDKTIHDYRSMNSDTQAAWDTKIEEHYLAAVIIEGCSEETSTLRKTLAEQFALSQDLYPRSTTRALEMLNEFKDTKERPKRGNNNRRSGTNDDKSQQSNRTSNSGNKQTGSISVNKGEVISQTDVEGAQILMAGLATNERFNLDDTVFVHLGHVEVMDSNDYESKQSDRSESTNDDWDFWLDRDAVDDNYHNEVAHTTPTASNNNHIRQPITEVVLEPDRSAENSTHAGAGSANTTLTTDSGTITSTEKGSEGDQSIGRKRKVSIEQRPDPPGIKASNNHHPEKPRSEYKNPRSGPPTNPRSGNDYERGWSNISALDLAITKWQSKSFMGGKYQYNEKIETMFAQHRGGIDPYWILLDSESSVNLIVNEDLISNIRIAPNNAVLKVHCNAGTATTNLIGDLSGFGTVWFYKDGIANVISLSLVTDKYKVTMDSSVDNAIYVHKDDGNIRRFARGSNNLYYYDTRVKSEETLLAITTVEGQKELFSGADRKRAERARKLQESIGFPSDRDFVRMIDLKTLQNCPVTRRDVQIAQIIYGKSRALIQGKTVRRQVPHVREDVGIVPGHVLDSYKDVTLCCDIFFLNGVRFFATISKHIKFRTVRSIDNARKRTLMECIKPVIGQYKARGFRVKTIFADNQFECLRNDLSSLEEPILLNTTATDEHEPFIERSNRTVKERIRCGYNSLPFKKLPIRMIIELVYNSVFWLNSLVPKDGVSNTISPRELLTGIGLDALKHAKYQFGEYMMVHSDETNNSMQPRATDAIYLRPSGNIQGGFFAFDLITARRVHRMHATPLPMTDNIIARVKEIADEQMAPAGLIFGDRNNKSTIHDLDEDENMDDDDASDGSYNPADDDRSVETELSGVSNTTEVSAMPEPEEVPVVERHDDGAGNNHVDAPVEDAAVTDNDAAVTDGDGDSEGEIMHEGEIEELSTNDETGDDDDASNTGDDTEIDTEEGNNEDAPPENTETRMTLRPTVRRSHNKYGALDGYESRTINRQSHFTAGYGPAMQAITRSEVGYIHAASAILQYNNIEASQVTKQYGVRQGIKIFGDSGVQAVLKELKQIHDRTVVTPMDPAKMTKEMRAKALPYLMFLKRKRCGTIKGRGCADGRRQRDFISKEEASSPTVSLHALMISCLIDAIEGRDVATADIPGAFLQTDMPDDEEVYIRLDGTMAELLCRLDPNLYTPCMIDHNGHKVLFARARKAIYGTLRAALLFWEKLSGTLSSWGFEANPYDRCTMNKMINGQQATILWHVDDLKISHKDPKVVTAILNDLNKEFGTISPLTVTRGKIHDYVGMTIDFTEAGRVKFSMFDYLEDILQGLPNDFKGTANTPASEHLFTVDEDGTRLSTDQADKFHHYVAKLLFMAKRTRPDIATAIAFLCTRVKDPDVHDWKKLGRVMKYLQLTPYLPLCLGWDHSGDVHWYVDASFAIHKDMRSHTGGVMTLGKGALISMSCKQKINTKSSTEAELVGVDDVLNVQVWSRYFLDSQYEQTGLDTLCKKDRLYQDNTSAMKLELNGKASSTKRTRHINIRYFSITDRVQSGKISIEYCPTDDMLADFFTKPLQGKLFRKHRNSVLGVTEEEVLQYKDAYSEAKLTS